MVKKVKLGLVVGGFLSLVHLLRCLIIAIMPTAMQNFLNWIFSLHFLNPVWIINPDYVTFGHAITLVVFTFVVGFIIGWILAILWNLAMKKKK